MARGGIVAVTRKKADGPTPEQLAHGGYGRTFTMHVESATEAMTHVSRHDPVERWKAADRLSEGQMAAIQLCRHLWELSGVHQRVTAAYGERTPASHGIEFRALSMIEARKDLHRIQDYLPPAYWSLFERVCRFGETAEEAGKRLDFGRDGTTKIERSAADRAHQVVCFVGDLIAMKELL